MPPRLGPLLADLCELKRVRCQGWPGRSLADAAFAAAWTDLAAGTPLDTVARAHLTFAAAHTRLGSVDWTALGASGVSVEERGLVYRRAAESALGPLSADERSGLVQLARNTCPRKPLSPLGQALRDTRWVERHAEEPLDPSDAAIRYAEHAFAVATAGAAIARERDEDVTAPFLFGVLHHATDVGNAPADAGFPEATMAPFRVVADPRGDLASSARIAFNAADGIDAVIERRAAVNQAGLSLMDALPADEIAPPGPLSAFHAAVVRTLGLAY